MEKAKPGQWGLYDCRDKCWLGNADGPLTYEEHLLARAAATISTEKLGRFIRPLVIDKPPFHLKDEVTSRYTGAEAIDRIEKRIIAKEE